VIGYFVKAGRFCATLHTVPVLHPVIFISLDTIGSSWLVIAADANVKQAVIF